MKSDSKTTHFGVAFPKVSQIFMSALISNLKTQVAYTFNSSLRSKPYVLAGCIKNNYTDVYSFDKDVLSLAKRPSFILVNTVISFAMRFF